MYGHRETRFIFLLYLFVYLNSFNQEFIFSELQSTQNKNFL